MKTFKILSVICASAVLFGWTACMDTDAQYTAADAPAPTFTGIICDQQDTLTTSSNTLSTGQQIYPGNHTVALLFDENIGFATSMTNQITLNGFASIHANLIGGLYLTGKVGLGLDYISTEGNEAAERWEAGALVGQSKGEYEASRVDIGFKTAVQLHWFFM